MVAEVQEKRTNVRWWLLLIVFLTALVAYFDRVNLSVTGPAVMQEYGFNRVEYGLTWSAFLLGYTIFQIPGGYLSNWLGIRAAGVIALMAWSIFTIGTPFAVGFYSFLLIRFFFGAGEAPMFPNNGSFLSTWFSKDEKALSSGIMLMGAFIAPAFATPLSVAIMEDYGWRSVFYIYGVAGVIIATVWYVFIRNSPQEHPQCNQAEIDHIGPPVGSKSMPWSAWKHSLGSIQFWALGVQYGVVCYILYIFLSWLPMYLLETRQLSMRAMGYAAMYPYFALSAGMLIGGRISDALVKSGKSKLLARTSFMIFGLIVCGIGLYLGANATTASGAITWLTVSLGFLGFNFTTSWTVCQDLGRSQSVLVVSWMNSWANIGAFLSPVGTALLVENFGWISALNVSAVIVVIGAIICLFVKPDKPLHD